MAELRCASSSRISEPSFVVKAGASSKFFTSIVYFICAFRSGYFPASFRPPPYVGGYEISFERQPARAENLCQTICLKATLVTISNIASQPIIRYFTPTLLAPHEKMTDTSLAAIVPWDLAPNTR